MPTWREWDEYNTSNGKVAGWLTWAGTSAITQDGTDGIKVTTAIATGPILTDWYCMSVETVTFSFQIKRKLADSLHEVTMAIVGQGANVVLTWVYATGIWTLTGGSNGGDAGTCAANTWCTVSITVTRSTGAISVSVDGHEPSTIGAVTNNQFCNTIFFSKLEGTVANPTWLREITIDQAKPSGAAYADRVVIRCDNVSANLAVGVTRYPFVEGTGTADFTGNTIGTMPATKLVTYNSYITTRSVALIPIGSSVIVRVNIAADLTSDSHTVAFYLFGVDPNESIEVRSTTAWAIHRSADAATQLAKTVTCFDVEVTRTASTDWSARLREVGGEWRTAVELLGHTCTAVHKMQVYHPTFFVGATGLLGDVLRVNEGWSTQTITSPSDVTVVVGEEIPQITWTVGGIQGGTFIITSNGETSPVGPWVDGDVISYSESEELAIGTYPIVITFTSSDGYDVISDTVIITIQSDTVNTPSGEIAETSRNQGGLPLPRIEASIRHLSREEDHVHEKAITFRRKHH